eukprot:257493-Chlamydomonas_euryale.AAC.7
MICEGRGVASVLPHQLRRPNARTLPLPGNPSLEPVRVLTRHAHLHEAEYALLHACAAGRADDDEVETLLGGVLDEARQLLPHHTAHGAAHVRKLHDAQRDGNAAQQPRAADDGILQARLLLRLDHTVLVALQVLEIERVARAQSVVQRAPAARVNERVDALLARHAQVVVAAEADVAVFLEVLDVENDAALVTAGP